MQLAIDCDCDKSRPFPSYKSTDRHWHRCCGHPNKIPNPYWVTACGEEIPHRYYGQEENKHRLYYQEDGSIGYTRTVTPPLESPLYEALSDTPKPPPIGPDELLSVDGSVAPPTDAEDIPGASLAAREPDSLSPLEAGIAEAAYLVCVYLL